MLVVTTRKLKETDYEVIDSKGIVTSSATVGLDVGASQWIGLDKLMGGEINSLTNLVNLATLKAKERLILEAEKKGANAIICLRFESAHVSHKTISVTVLAYGTAVLIKS